ENDNVEAEVDVLLPEKSTNENDNVTSDVLLTSNSVIEVNNDLEAEYEVLKV
ncbi:24042_t:CDS:2, partial [Dentiscutata erythropus]